MAAAVLAAASVACAPADPAARARAAMSGGWGALIRAEGRERDSLALRLEVRPTGAVTGTGVRWIGRERMPLAIRGRVAGDTLVLAVSDSGGRAVHGPATITVRWAGDTLAGTLTEGPFESRTTFHHMP